MTIGMRGFLLASVALVAASTAGASHAAVTISSAATKNMACASGVCTPTAKNATLNVSDLTGMLASGNVTVNTGSSPLASQVRDIVVSTGFNWTSANGLTLDAWRSVTVEDAIADNGSGAVTLTTNDGGTGGALSFGATGSLAFLATTNSLTINASAYTLVNSVASLASAITANPAGAYALANSYNASPDGTYGGPPVMGTFAGAVQGLGNTISNLNIDQGKGVIAYTGLFDITASGASIENLRLTNINYSCSGHRLGGGGGLVGQNQGYLFGDSVQGIVHLVGEAGGLVGGNTASGIIVLSSADVNVRSRQFGGGGLVATNAGQILLSHADGSVGGAESGGLVGENVGQISESYATGAAEYAGFVGQNGCQDSVCATIENSYSSASLKYAGAGFIYEGGDDGATITSSYAMGVLAAGDGGFACNEDAANAFSSDYWDTTSTGASYGECGDLNPSGVTGLTTTQLKSGLPAGFDPTIWAENSKINKGFPYLINNPPPAKKKK